VAAAKDSESDLRAALTPELSPDTILSGLTLDKPTVFVVPTIGTDRASMNAGRCSGAVDRSSWCLSHAGGRFGAWQPTSR
jgi:hypothetical protein